MQLVSRRTVPPSWRSPCAWLVVFALMWGILAPRMAQALGPSGGSWIEVCTGLGMQRVQVDAGFAHDAPDDKPAASTTGDCPNCRLHATLALPPAGDGADRLETPPHVAPSGRAAPAPTPAPPWRPAQPRGPPSTIPV